MIYELQK